MNNANNNEMLNVSGSISGNYGLTINDANSNPIILSGANTYSGTTDVASGALAVNGSLAPSSSVTVAAGASLTGSGNVGATTVNSGGKILGGYNNIGSLTLASLAFAGSSNIFGALGNSTTSPAPIIVNGALTTSASTIFVNLTGTLPTVSGTYPFLQYGTLGGSGSASFQLAAASRAYALTNVTGATNYLGVTYTAGLYPIWTGSNSTAFVGGTNWKLSTNGSPTEYMNLDNVVFDDSASSTTVNVNQNVTPTSTTFNNSTLSYTLTGANGIMGAGSLTKNGTAGLLTIANTNGYTGGTFINGGTLAAASIGNSGVASALGAGTGITLNGGVLAITNNNAGNSAMATNRAIAIGASGGSLAIVGTSSGGFTSNGTISGSNALALTGTGLFTIPVYNNAFTGGFIVNAGTLAFGNTNNNVGQSYLGSGPLVVNSGAVAYADNVNSLGYTNNGSLYGAVVSSVTLNAGILVASTGAGNTKSRLPNTSMTAGTISGIDGTSEFDPANSGGTMMVTVNPSTLTSVINVGKLGLLSNVSFNVSQGSTASGVDLRVTSALNKYINVSSVTKSGPGEMVLSGTSSYDGGTNVVGGTLIVTNIGGIADGTSLNVGDPSLLSLLPAPIVPAPPASGYPAAAAVSPVPEPGTLALLAAAAIAAGCGAWRRRKSR
jgi:autotransporter-associated beta strand protein